VEGLWPRWSAPGFATAWAIMRACLETQKLEQLEARMDEIVDRVARALERDGPTAEPIKTSG